MIQCLFFIVEGKFSINEICLNAVEDRLKDKKGNLLYLIIQSDGGDPFSSVRIMNLLQNKFETIKAIVPNQAMSAATLMALGADEIYLREKSMLGPLDLPIEHPRDGSRISALDVQNTITTLASLSDTVADNRFTTLRKEFGLGKTEAARIAYETGNKFIEPIVSQVDPYHLQKSYRELRIGWYYAYDLLKTRMMAHDYYQAWETAKALVNNYPAHEYGIFTEEAKKKLKLTIKDLNELKDWTILTQTFEDLEKKYNKIIRYQEFKHDEQPAKSNKKEGK